MVEQSVGSVMTTKVVSVRPETAYKELVETLAANQISALPVVDSARKIIGVVSEVDAMAKSEFHGGADGTPLLAVPSQRRRHRKAVGTTAADLMTRPALTIGPDEPVAVAARRLATERVRRLFVVGDSGELVGVVSRRDVLSTFLRADNEISADVQRRLATYRGMWLAFPEVDVRVADGIVTIDGSVYLRSTVDLVRQLALTIPGVVGVHTNISYEIDDGLSAGL